MKKALLCAILILSALLSGCQKYREVENLAYVIVLGVDLLDNGDSQSSALIPKITGEASSDSEGAPDSGHRVYAAAEKAFGVALERLRWVVPRNVDLSQVKLIVLSERLARSGQFMSIAYSMMDTYHLYTAARLAVCAGETLKFIQSETGLLGSRIATDLEAMFDHYANHAFIPDVQFADVFYKSVSIYSDPLAIYSTSGPAEEVEAAAALIEPQTNDRDGDVQPQINRFLGSCVFKKSVMVGTLSAEETLFCKLLRGKPQSFPLLLGIETLYLSMATPPMIEVDTDSDPVQIRIDLQLSLQTRSERVDTDAIRELLTNQMLATIDRCKRMGVEPFQFAEVAARNFLSIGDWMAYDWSARFPNSEIELNIEIRDQAG